MHVATEQENIYRAGTVEFEAWNDRLVIIEDPFVSGYECETCESTGTIVCDGCGGTGHSAVVRDAKCTRCQGGGKLVCDSCKGKGELLVVPEVSQRRPTTGTVVSVGRDVREILKGEAVMYHDFVGAAMDLSGADSVGRERTVVLRIIREADVLCKVRGHLEMRRMRKKTVGESL